MSAGVALEAQCNGVETAAEQNLNDELCEDDDNLGSRELLELQEEQEEQEQEEQVDDDLLAILTVTMDRLHVEN